MTEQEILEGLKEILTMVKPKADISKVGMESQLALDLAIDSLSMLLMSLAIEQKFGFEFTDRKPFRTVGDVVNYISEKV